MSKYRTEPHGVEDRTATYWLLGLRSETHFAPAARAAPSTSILHSGPPFSCLRAKHFAMEVP